MARFLTGSNLNASIEKILETATEELIIVSPYIKLHNRFIDILKSQKSSDKLSIQILFGKNEKNLAKSIDKEDFEFLKEFPNIKICYNERLHAKYYSNENRAVLSSMNLYDYSQNNNIEFGIETNINSFGSFAGIITGESLDGDAFKYFKQVLENSDVLFERVPQYEGKWITKKYTHSLTLLDDLSGLIEEKKNRSSGAKNKEKAPWNSNTSRIGYCIRTGTEIRFNPERPMCKEAFQSWNRFGDKDYREKFCHYSGEPSEGNTSFAKPILRKNWKKATKTG